MNKITRRTVTAVLAGATASLDIARETERWLVYYSDREPLNAFAPYSLHIFDSRYHPPLAPLLETRKKLAGYVSLGEAAPDYSYYAQLESQHLLLKPSSTWKGNYYIDI